MAGLMNLCSVANVVWFRDVRKPLDDTSKASTVHLYSLVSVMKCAYLLVFSVCLCSMLCSEGHVSSNRWMVFALSSRITMSGLSVVTHSSGSSECNVYPNTKYSGHNLYPLGGETQEECAAACLQKPECHFWTHNPNVGRCWLKKSDLVRSPSTKGSNSGQKSCGVTGERFF